MVTRCTFVWEVLDRGVLFESSLTLLFRQIMSDVFLCEDFCSEIVATIDLEQFFAR